MFSVNVATEFAEAGSQGVLPVRHQVSDSLHVLVAEDNPVNQRLVETLLQLSGHRCVTVGDGMAAVRAVQQDSFDLVLMDIRMPEMSGLEATRAIRALGANYATLPIIAMTANAEEDEAENCAAAGMTSYLSKPIDRQRFQALLGVYSRQKALANA